MPRTRVKIPEVYLKGKNPLNFAGNGRLCYATAAVETSAYVNMLLGRRRKILGSTWITSMTGATSGKQFLVYCRTGPATRAMVVVLTAIPADSTASGASLSDTPSFLVTASSTLLPVPTSAQSYVNRRDTGTIVADDYFVNVLRMDPVIPSENYEIAVNCGDYARAYNVTIYEEVDDFLPQKNQMLDKHVGASGVSIATFLTRLVDTDAEWDARNYTGCNLTLSNFPTAGNNGTFKVTHASATSLTYSNPSVVAEAADADSTYEIDDLICRRPQAMRTVLASEYDDMAQRAYAMWQDGGGHLFSWANPAGIASGVGAVTYNNLHDVVYTSYNSAAPGHWTWPEKRGTYDSATVPVTCWAYAKKSSAGAGGSVSIRFRNSAGTIATMSTTSTTTVLLTGTGTLDSTLTEDKVEVATIGNGTDGITVYAYGMFQAG